MRRMLFLLCAGCSSPSGSTPDAPGAIPDAPGATVDAAVDALVLPDAGPIACQLAESGPIVVAADGQVIENLRITSTAGPAITVQDFVGVVIRNCEVLHAGGPGISFDNADDLLIHNVAVVHTGAPASGPNASNDTVNIDGEGSARLVIDHVRLERGASGVYLLDAPGAKLSFVEGHDFRGPFPRGQLVQFNHCDGASLEDFSSENPPATSFPEDVVSVFQSSDVTLRRGLVDGDNSPSGVGIMFEQSDGVSSGGFAEDVDAVRQGNGCFSAYPGRGVVFRRTRARDNICADQGRGPPLSGGLAWAGSPDSSNIHIQESTYFNLCHDLYWDPDVFTQAELTSADFAARAPLRLTFCWE